MADSKYGKYIISNPLITRPDVSKEGGVKGVTFPKELFIPAILMGLLFLFIIYRLLLLKIRKSSVAEAEITQVADLNIRIGTTSLTFRALPWNGWPIILYGQH